jgi:hypothetical protein
MARAVEWFVAVTGLVLGASHLLRPADWVEAFRRLHGLGRSGAFINGTLSLAGGGGIIAGHNSWAWPGVALTVFGWLLVAKGTTCLLAPDQALRSMERGTRRGFVIARVMLWAIAAWAVFCLWYGPRGG